MPSASPMDSSTSYDMNGHNNNNGQQQDGGEINNDVVATNGESSAHRKVVKLDKTNQEIVRLIGQHLKNIGLERSAEALMQESGCCLEHPSATKFRKHVLSGDWTKADHDLQELQTMVDPKADRAGMSEMKFLLLEQKYLEFLEEGRPIDALHVLRNELTPLQHNTPRVHQLSSYMMCTNNQVRVDPKGEPGIFFFIFPKIQITLYTTYLDMYLDGYSVTLLWSQTYSRVPSLSVLDDVPPVSPERLGSPCLR